MALRKVFVKEWDISAAADILGAQSMVVTNRPSRTGAITPTAGNCSAFADSSLNPKNVVLVHADYTRDKMIEIFIGDAVESAGKKGANFAYAGGAASAPSCSEMDQSGNTQTFYVYDVEIA